MATIALGTYREAVRARLLLGVFALGLCSSLYAVVVASMSAHNELRVVSDLGAASSSLYGIVIAIVLGSTSLYREIEHKTVFPILSRPLRRWEYLVGKYLGTVLTVAVFVAVDGAATLLLLAAEAGVAGARLLAVAGVFAAAFVVAAVRAPRAVIFFVIPWSLVLFGVAWSSSSAALGPRQLVTTSAVLAVFEVAIVAAVATLFASFSSPFLTATCTFMVVVIGRSADTLAHLPKRLFGTAFASCGRFLAHVVPNLQVYVPARSLLLGEAPGQHPWAYVASAAGQATAYAVGLLAAGALVFRRRDFS